MAQRLPNELLIIIFKELLNKESFGYMNSICTVCKKWNELIKLVLTEEIEFRLKRKLLIGKKYKDFNNCSNDFSNSTCNIFVNNNNNNNFELDFPFNENNENKVCIHFKYENSEEYLVEFNLGTLLFSDDMSEVKYNIKWNYKDCMYIPKNDSRQLFGISIKIEKLVISLKKMSVILDLLDEKLNTKDPDNNVYKYIIKKPTFDVDDFISYHHYALSAN